MNNELVASRSVPYWRERITERWQESVQAIIDVGRLLLAAKAALEHGQFQTLFEGEDRLPFGWNTANKLMAIARDRRLINSEHVQNLPNSWGTLYELTKLDNATFAKALEDGTIHAEMERREALGLRDERDRRSFETAPLFGTCTARELEVLIARGMKFGTVYADPPWLYENQGTRAATSNHYGGMTVEEIAALPIAKLAAENAHLHLWTTNAFLFDCKAIIEAWGFEYKSCFVWTKPQLGIGNYWRLAHEFMLLGVRGSCPFLDRGQISWLHEPRGQHSAKPERIREIVEKVSPGPRLELFARRITQGWVCWGNEIERSLFDQQEAVKEIGWL